MRRPPLNLNAIGRVENPFCPQAAAAPGISTPWHVLLCITVGAHLLIVRRAVFERRNLAAETGACGVHQVTAYFAAAVGEAVREHRALFEFNNIRADSQLLAARTTTRRRRACISLPVALSM